MTGLRSASSGLSALRPAAFGADPALPIPVPAADVPPLAGVFRRVGDTVTVTPAADVALRLEDGSQLQGETSVEGY